MEVASLQKEYDEINVRLSVLYEEADSIMAKKENFFLLNSTLDELKDVHFSMQHLSVKAIGIERAFLLTSIGSQISRKVVFDESVNKWLEEREVSKEEIKGLLCVPKTLRFHTSGSRSHRSGRSSASSARKLKPSRRTRWHG